MGSARALISILAVVVFTSASIRVAHGCEVNIVNQCTYSVTTCAQGGQNGITQYNLGPGDSQNVNFGNQCSWPGGTIWTSVSDKCATSPGSSDATDKNLANWAEISLGYDNGADIYALSNENAYTIGMAINVTRSAGGSCPNIECVICDIRSFCQGDNKIVTEQSGASVCVNTDGTGGTQTPTANTDYFAVACPEAVSYPNNTALLASCNTGSDYQVTFCP